MIFIKVKIIIVSIIAIAVISIPVLTSCSILSPAGITPGETSSSGNEMESKTSGGQVSVGTEETTSVEIEITAENNISDQIIVRAPETDQLIQSPLIIEGEARGTWFFEATFPVKLLDANRNLVASHFAQTDEDWMTEDFIGFKAQIEFKKPPTATGILVLEKDNPSGLAEYDARIEIPVRFE